MINSLNATTLLAGAGVEGVRNYRLGFGIWQMQGGKVARR